MSDRLIVPMRCDACGAPLRALLCEYCGTEHERVERYIGPTVIELEEMTVPTMVVSNYRSMALRYTSTFSTAANTATNVVYWRHDG